MPKNSNHLTEPCTADQTNELLTRDGSIIELDGKRYKKLNEMQDITIAGVTYHVTSSFSSERSLTELLDLATLDQIKRTASSTCFKV